MNKEVELVEGQVIEVEFDPELVKEYQENYIMEEEGMGADEVGSVYGEQTTFNEDGIEELLDPETVVEDYQEVGEE